MPVFPLPTGDNVLNGGDLVVSDADDVLKELPATHKRPSSAPVRDAFVEAWLEGFKRYQIAASYAAAQSDPTQATGDYLRSYAAERGVIPRRDETEDELRERLFLTPAIVSPDAIMDGVNEILAPYSDKECYLHELELDGMFAHDGTATWHCFVGAGPEYPDRYYADVPSSDPGGAIPSSGWVRNFLLRIPSLQANDIGAYALTDSSDGVFALDVEDDNAINLFEDPAIAEELYATIINFVERIKGGGITWSLVVDPDIV